MDLHKKKMAFQPTNPQCPQTYMYICRQSLTYRHAFVAAKVYHRSVAV